MIQRVTYIEEGSFNIRISQTTIVPRIGETILIDFGSNSQTKYIVLDVQYSHLFEKGFAILEDIKLYVKKV